MGWTIALIALAAVVLIVALVVLLRGMTFAQPLTEVEEIELVDVEKEVVAEHLGELLRIRTISLDENAPVERAAFHEMHRTLEKLYPRVHSSLEIHHINDCSLIYIWRGKNPALPPRVLAGHMDVVPVDSDADVTWSYPPFSGQVAEDYLWGRGAMDDKCQVMGVLEALEGLLKVDYQPERTLIAAFGHDEEVGGYHGAKEIVAWLAEAGLVPDAVLDEGGAVVDGLLPGLEIPAAMVGVAEKGVLTLELSVEARGGHSSTPERETAISVLAKAIAQLEANPQPAHIDAVMPMFRSLGAALPFSQQLVFANQWLFGGVLKNKLEASPSTNATIRTTLAATMIKGGVKENILPRTAQALVNIRLLPGDTIAEVCERVRKIIGDERVKLQAKEGCAWEASPVSPIDGPAFESLELTIRQVFDSVPVTPYVVLGATDSRHYADLCPQVYRFTPYLVDSTDLKRMHGVDERISLDSLSSMVQFYRLLIIRWFGAEED